jgi:hypothetical protein
MRWIIQFFSGLLVRPVSTGVEQRESAHPAEAAVLASVEDRDDLLALTPLLEFDGSGVPDLDLTGSVLPLRDRAFEAAVFQRVVLGLDGQVVLARVGRRPLRQGPGDQHTIVFEPEVPVQPSSRGAPG